MMLWYAAGEARLAVRGDGVGPHVSVDVHGGLSGRHVRHHHSGANPVRHARSARDRALTARSVNRRIAAQITRHQFAAAAAAVRPTMRVMFWRFKQSSLARVGRLTPLSLRMMRADEQAHSLGQCSVRGNKTYQILAS